MRSLIPLSLLLTVFDLSVHAFVFPFHVHIGGVNPNSLSRRAPVSIRNIGNAQYVSNITLAGQQLQVLLDTGSSDLWVHFPGQVPESSLKNTGKSTSLSYARGSAGGPILTGQASMGSASVSDQAFMLVNDTSTFSEDPNVQLGYDGLLGIGPNSGSVVRKKLGNSAGDTFLQRVFEGNKSTENYITVLLNRVKDPGQNYTGQFTIAELLPGFEKITTMPKLDVEKVNRILKADQHWQALTDKDQGLIGPDGVPIQMSSIVPKAPDGQYVAVLDSGFTFSQVPRAMSDAIYGRVQGAFYDVEKQWWLIPCGQYLNVSFNFGGISYPMHPFDLVDDNFLQVDATGKKVCIGSFQPITTAFSILGHYDMILGMNFLRSAHALLNFGNWIANSGGQDAPYMQLLSTVDPIAARKDFINVRLGGNDTISDPKWAILPANQTVHSPVSAEEKKKKYQEMILSRWPYIFIGCLAFLILTTGFCIYRCCCRKRAKDSMGASKFNPFKKAKRESYVPLAAQRSVADLSSPYSATYPQQQQQQQHNYPSSTYPTPQYPPEQGHRNSQQSYHSQHSYHSQQAYPSQQDHPSQQAYPSQQEYPSQQTYPSHQGYPSQQQGYHGQHAV